MPINSKSNQKQWWLLLTLIILVAAALRLWGLPGIPPGPHYDEAANGVLAAEIARGDERPLFITSYTGKEVLFFYWKSKYSKYNDFPLTHASICVSW